ncbi:MAG: isoprenylcysteine carboxylmethyltransferase family protein [Thermoanaerobaculia bacterium]
MDTARYWLALVLVVSIPPGFIYWFVIHPFAGFWRRLGPVKTHMIVAPAMILVGFGIYQFRQPLMRVDFGFVPPFAVLAVLSYLFAAFLELKCRRYLKLKILMGGPELAQDPSAGSLLSEGIYSRIRHPRYLSVFFGSLAVALFANFLASWLLMVLLIPVIYVLAVIEERELLERFGGDYRRYMERVPRFVPRSRPDQE